MLLPHPVLRIKISNRFDPMYTEGVVQTKMHVFFAPSKDNPNGKYYAWCGKANCPNPKLKAYDKGKIVTMNNDLNSFRYHYNKGHCAHGDGGSTEKEQQVTAAELYAAETTEAFRALDRMRAGAASSSPIDTNGPLSVKTRSGKNIVLCPLVPRSTSTSPSSQQYLCSSCSSSPTTNTCEIVSRVSTEEEQLNAVEFPKLPRRMSGVRADEEDKGKLAADADDNVDARTNADTDDDAPIADDDLFTENVTAILNDGESTAEGDSDAKDELSTTTDMGEQDTRAHATDADGVALPEAEAMDTIASSNGASNCNRGRSNALFGSKPGAMGDQILNNDANEAPEIRIVPDETPDLFTTMVSNANSSKEDEVPENKLPENKTRILRKINNDDMVFHIVAGILLPDYQKKKHKKKYRVADITSGERKYTSKLPKSHFHIEEFDLHKHSGHPSGNYDGVFKPMVLLLRGKFHIVLVDPPYMSAAGGHHLCNCGPRSIPFQNHNRKYGIDAQLSRQQIVGLCGRLIETAMRKTEISGYVLVKCQAYRQFPLDAIVMELASKAGGLEYETKFMLETTPTKRTNQENFSTMFVFKRVKRISPKSGLVLNDFVKNESADSSKEEIDRLIMLTDNEFQEQAKEALDKVAVASNIVLKLCSHLVEECGESEDEVKKFVLEYLNEISALDRPFGHSHFTQVVNSFDASKAADMYKAIVADVMKREKKERLKRKNYEQTQLSKDILACFLKSNKKSRTDRPAVQAQRISM